MKEPLREEHHKLVRDRLPLILQERGIKVTYEIVAAEQLRSHLRLKLVEEAKEYIDTGDPAELIDVLEVVRALAATHETSWDTLENRRAEKAALRGGFEQGIFLVETIEPSR